MNFKFSNLLGAPYRGGNVLIVGDSLLLSPVGNRISATDLVKSESFTLPCQNSKNITKIAVSPNGAFLLSIDEDGRSLLINLPRRVVLHHFTFKGPVSAVKFSSNGCFFATGVGKLLQVWQTPGFRKEFTPFQLFKTYGGCHDTITSLDWSPDSNWIIVGCKDLTARVYSIQNLVGYHPITLTGHRNTLIGVYFTSEKEGKDKDRVTGAYTISKDGAIFSWSFHLSELSTLSKDVSLVGTEAVADPSKQTRSLQALATTPVRFVHGGDKLEGKGEDEDDDFTVLLDPRQRSEGIERADSDLGSHETNLPSSGPSPLKSVTKKKHKTESGSTETMRKDSQAGGQKIRTDRDLNCAENWEPTGGESQNEASLQNFQSKDQNGPNDEEHEESDGEQEERRSIDFEEELIQTGGKRKRSTQTDESHGHKDKMDEPDDDRVLQTNGVVGAKAETKYTIRPDAGKWQLVQKHFFMQNAKLTACDYHKSLNIVVAGFSTGIFGLYQMPDFSCIHLLSISRTSITATTINDSGNWLVFGCAKLGQLLVWEWHSETYILKQQGHYFDVNCVAYSPDSQLIASGADDNKLKVWNSASGFCFVTFSEHTNAVTAVLFLPGNHAVLSASLDGTVRAWDLMRYRNFRTFTTPSPTQFVSLAADQSGEVICAGTLDSFQIYVWAMKTGRLLEVLSGHEGPVHGLVFSPTHEMLASSSWDKTVRLWDVFEGKGGVETFTHTHDVLTVSYRPDGRQLASTTLEGHIHFWDPFEGQLMGTIEGRRDIAGGRLMSDRRSAANSSSGKCFTTICYSADGGYLIAGGTSKYICMYDVTEQVLLRRFQISHNYSFDGVLDFLNSKRMTDAGPIDLIDDADSDKEIGIDRQARRVAGHELPGTLSNAGRPIVRTKCLQISPTGRSWAAATTEGLLIYSVDDALLFDPSDLDIDVTPETVLKALEDNQHIRALVLALRLNEPTIIRKCVEAVHPSDISLVARNIPIKYLGTFIGALAEYLENSAHLEFLLHWCQALCVAHGKTIQSRNKDYLPALRSLLKGLTRLHEELGSACSTNQYLLQYLCSVP